MGLLGMLGIGGGAGGLSGLTQGLGNKGGLLSKFGKGQFGGDPTQMGGGLDALGDGGFREFLQKLMPQEGSQGGGEAQGSVSPQPRQFGTPPGGNASGSLANMISQYIVNQMRR